MHEIERLQIYEFFMIKNHLRNYIKG